MKKHLFLTMLLFLSCITFAQSYYLPMHSSDYWPKHPLDTRIGDKPSVQPDTVGWTDPFDILYPLQKGGFNSHKYGSDGYIDTAYHNMSSSISIYSKENNKLISFEFWSGLVGVHPISQKVFFEYDNKGRQTKHYIKFYNYDGDGKLAEVIDSTVFNYDFSKVIYTDSGYIFNNAEYVFDSKDRLIKYSNPRDTSVYTYFDDKYGYSVLVDVPHFSPPGETPSVPGERGKVKTEYYFQEDGLIKNIIEYSYIESKGWRQREDSHFDYTYSKDPITQGTLSIENNCKIFGITGAITIQSNISEWISIYSISGQLIKKVWVQSGSEQIPLSKGIYIISASDYSYKVHVK